jgi:hypothetical protein
MLTEQETRCDLETAAKDVLTVIEAIRNLIFGEDGKIYSRTAFGIGRMLETAEEWLREALPPETNKKIN